MIGRVCKQCGAHFKVKPHKIKEGKGIYCSRVCANRGVLTGKPSRAWKGGRHMISGYVAVFAPNHPNASVQQRRYVLEHRAVAAKMLGRPLVKGEVVHHKNGIKTDNRPENLVVITQSEHMRLHFAEWKEKPWDKKQVGA